jgi:hypothetical protein
MFKHVRPTAFTCTVSMRQIILYFSKIMFYFCSIKKIYAIDIGKAGLSIGHSGYSVHSGHGLGKMF